MPYVNEISYSVKQKGQAIWLALSVSVCVSYNENAVLT